ncbi:M1 family aminopeptidase [Streptomyces sp. NPDC008150]|uniref:M1 family metallopeptidase n=1 Tax=Streptomyces sp. NPDC008150 TaxID=3364816 RepID=UPI0036E98B2A
MTRLTAAALLAPALAALGACGAGDGGAEGAAGVGDPYFPEAGNGGYDVGHYGLTLAYDPGRPRLTGTAVITARATRDLTAFDLDLVGLTVGEVSVDGRAARWRRVGQELTVRPARPLARGAVFRTTVAYAGVPRTLTDPDGSEEGWLRTPDGAVALGEPTGSATWFPGSHHPSDKAAYDIEVTVPKGHQAVSNGELTSERTAGDRTVLTWRAREPVAPYVVTVAVGRFTVTRSTVTGLRDRPGLPSYVAVVPSEVPAARPVLARIPAVLRWEEGLFGPYPFSSTGAVVARRGLVGYALETQNRPVFPGAPDTTTLVHELAHQWYGDSVTPRTWRDMWLNEGFATYAEWLWAEEHGGDSAQETFDALYRTGADAGLWAFPPARPSDAAHISDSPVYERGAMVLHRVRRAVGDTRFRAILRGWATAHRHGNADTADFTRYVERAAPGTDFGAVWADWLYGEGKPKGG